MTAPPLLRSIALVLVWSLLASACVSDDGGTGPPGPPTDPVEALDQVRFGVPSDCATNPFCADGLARVYGIDVFASMVTVAPGAPTAAALRRGEIEVGVLFSEDPEIDAPDLVVLDDDRGMLASENVVVIGSDDLVADRGAGLVEAIDAVSASLTQDDLRQAVAQVRSGRTPREVAAAMVAAGPDPAVVELESTVPVRIGAKAFPTDLVLAHWYSAGLAVRGVPTEVVELDGLRALEVAAMTDGEIDLAVDYAASLLEYLDGFVGRAGDDPAETVATLDELVGLADFAVLSWADVESSNTFVMLREVAERHGITALGDLVGMAAKARPAPPPGERPPGDPLGLVGPQMLRVGSTGPAVLELQQLLIDLGHSRGPLNGIFEEPTRRAVSSFQEAVGLAPDGVAGPRTVGAMRAAAADPGSVPEPSEPPPDPHPAPLPPPGSVVHLTFDDGPSRYTSAVLDLLDRFDAQAVFFVIGSQVEGAAVVGRAVEAGHRLGNHTWTHRSLAGVSRSSFDEEVGRSQDVIEAATGRRPTCLRPPFGATDADTATWAAEAGLSVVLWDVDPQDWARPGVDAIVSSVVDHARPGSIILMHDGGGHRDQTVVALERILEQLSARGFAFTLVPGC